MLEARPVLRCSLCGVAMAVLMAAAFGCAQARHGTTAASPTTGDSTIAGSASVTPSPGSAPTRAATARPGYVLVGGAGAARGSVTGIASVDAVIESIAQADVEALARLMRTQERSCTREPGPGQGPACAAGEAAGTRVSVFAVSACEGGWVRDVRMEASAVIDARPELFAIVRFDGTPRYDVVLSTPFPGQPGQRVMHVVVDGDAISHVSEGCGPAPAGLRALEYRASERPMVVMIGPAFPR